MDEVARQLGVSKGSLYLYVESKEALFDLCVRYADDGGKQPVYRCSGLRHPWGETWPLFRKFDHVQ